MKLSHLSLAVLSAIALAACGGSSNGVQTTPDQNNTGNTGGTTGGNTGDTGGTTGGNTGDTGGTTGGNTGNTGGNTGGTTGDTGGTTGGNTGDTGGTTGGNTGDTGGNTGDTGGNTDDQNDTDDGSTGGNTGDGSTGDGSTGDGSTGDGSTGDGSTGDGSTDDTTGGNTNNAALSNDVKAALSNNAATGLNQYFQPSANRQFPGQNAAVTSVNNPQNVLNFAQLGTLATQKGYLKNPDLYNQSGNLDAFTATEAGQSAQVAYLDDSGNFQFAFIAQSGAGQPYRYYKDNGSGAVDLSAPLEASDLYQVTDLVNNADPSTSGAQAVVAGNSLTNVTGFKVFDQAFAKPATAATQYAEIDRSKIKVGEIVEAPVYAQVQYTAAKASPVLGGTAQNQNITQSDSDGNPAILQETKDIKVGSVKAYNLPHSLTTVSAYDNGAGIGPYFQANYNPTPTSVVQVTGLRTLDLPQSATATYTGKVFSASSQGDISLDVEFGTTNSAYVKNVKITNRSDATNSNLKSMVGVAPAAVNYAGVITGSNNDDYTVNLVAEDGVNPPTPEYQSLGGKFYGSKAEETAGATYLLQNGSNNTTAGQSITGAFAAQRGDLK